jgi:hypothetical protein
MLKNTKMCPKCIGRVQQVAEFFNLKQDHEHKKCSAGCDFCYREFDGDMIPVTMASTVRQAVNDSMWAAVSMKYCGK